MPPMAERPLFLLTNDDGYRAEGIRAARSALAKLGEVIVCAPESEQSATSHSLSLHRPLRLRPTEAGCFSVDGTPADSVYVALNAGDRVLPRRPDLVVSGVNHGVNLGDDVFYSGTVAAAREGALKGIPALAVSAALGVDLERAATHAAKIAHAMLNAEAEAPYLLNVNYPVSPQWKVRATRLGTRTYDEGVEFRRDPRGREYLWIGGPGVSHEAVVGSDTEAFDGGVVGVTPLVLDLWARKNQSLAERVAEAVGNDGSS